MVFDVTRYRELTPEEGRSASSFTFSQRDGSATVPVVIYGDPEADGITALEIQEAIRTAQGYVEGGALDGRITRHLPMRHALFPRWPCSAVTRGQGTGEFSSVAPFEDEGGDVNPMNAFGQWAKYKYQLLDLEFKPRPYRILADADIPVLAGSYVDIGGTTRTYQYAQEWLRYTRIIISQMDADRITAEEGSFQYNSNATVNGVAINGTSFMGHPTMPLMNSTVLVSWYEVPYNYVVSPNSYLTRWRGRINQTAWRGYPAGSLLYDGFTADVYSSPFPAFGLDEMDLGGNPILLCDIQLKFVMTNRKLDGSLNAAVLNGNCIASGHNLLPYFPNRKFYYAASAAGVPSFWSFPIELLFTNPDADIGALATTID